MSMLWCGGEDIDYLNAGTPTPDTDSSKYRSSWARCAVKVGGAQLKGNQYPGGAVTSAWRTWRMYLLGSLGSGAGPIGGVGQFSSTKGLYIGAGPSSGNQITLFKYDGTTQTTLAAESGTSFTSGSVFRIDMQILNYGAGGTVNVYFNGLLVLTYTGNIAVSGMTNFDCNIMGSVSNGDGMRFSEDMTTSDDSRAYLGLATLALSSAGSTNSWTNNTYTNINGVTFSDSSPAYDNNDGDNQQYNVADLPSGSFAIAGVKQSARAAIGAGSSVAHLKLGYNSGGTVGFGTGATKAPAGAYSVFEQIDLVNPITGVAFTQSEINALQLNMQAAT